MADPEPDNMLAAKFSIPYAVAAMLVRGNANVTAFYPDQVANPQIRELAGVVEVAADSEMSLRRYDYPSARVAVSLKDGRRLEQSVTAQRGDYRNPVTRDELLAKFRFLATETLGESRTSQVIDAVGSLEKLGNVRELTGLLRAG
jgi:2-methylcitrate dehydratase PrpD